MERIITAFILFFLNIILVIVFSIKTVRIKTSFAKKERTYLSMIKRYVNDRNDINEFLEGKAFQFKPRHGKRDLSNMNNILREFGIEGFLEPIDRNEIYFITKSKKYGTLSNRIPILDKITSITDFRKELNRLFPKKK